MSNGSSVFGFELDKLFIDGEWRSPVNNCSIVLLNPSDGSPLANVAAADEEDIDRAVIAANKAAHSWGKSTALTRARLLQRLQELVQTNAKKLARLESIDVGKPLDQAAADVAALQRYLEYYAGAADKLHGQTIPYQEGYSVSTYYEPHGVTGHIIPWNYPLQIIGRSVVAALAVGNCVVIKPSEEACLSALAFAQLTNAAGFPAGVVNVLPGVGSVAGAALAEHSGVHHVSFTGSEPAGVRVQSAAAQHVAPVTLELGGKSAQIVFDDADLDAALPFLLKAGLQNSGQTCSASSRILVQRGVYRQIVERLAQQYQNLEVGPALKNHDLGPLISARQKTRVQSYLDRATDLHCVAMGKFSENLPTEGFYLLPHLFDNVPVEHPLAQEEIFGPIQLVTPFDDEEQALSIANGTDYGLVAAIWTRDGGRQLRFAKALRAGQVFVNNYGAGGGVELPFGGVGRSGHGREKGFAALYGFTALKTVAIYHGA